jgi:hypothetical protein
MSGGVGSGGPSADSAEHPGRCKCRCAAYIPLKPEEWSLNSSLMLVNPASPKFREVRHRSYRYPRASHTYVGTMVCCRGSSYRIVNIRTFWRTLEAQYTSGKRLIQTLECISCIPRETRKLRFLRIYAVAYRYIYELLHILNSP